MLFATHPNTGEICPGNFTTNRLLKINTLASLLFILNVLVLSSLARQ